MAQYTKKAILTAFRQMLEQMPFDKITVSAIVAKCQISPNTFYYHFRDIYDLLETFLREVRTSLFSDYQGDMDDLKKVAKRLFYVMKENPEIVYHLAGCLSRDHFERYILFSTKELFYRIVCQRAEGQELSESMLLDIAQFCCYSFLGFFMKFIWSHMSLDIEDSVERIGTLFDGFIEQAIKNCKKRGEQA